MPEENKNQGGAQNKLGELLCRVLDKRAAVTLEKSELGICQFFNR